VYRDTVLLRFMHGLSPPATAAAMGVPEETVRTRQKRALVMLRARLAPPQQRRLAALSAGLAAWGVTVKSKIAVLAVAILLFSLALSVPFWTGAGSNGAEAPPATAMLQARMVPAAKPEARGEDASTATRTEVPALPAAEAGSITMVVTWKD